MILITGCNGSLGSQLATSLIAEGERVRAFIRPGADLSLIPISIKDKIEWCEGSLFDSYALGNALEGVEQIVHTAAVVSFSPARRKEMFRTNVPAWRLCASASP